MINALVLIGIICVHHLISVLVAHNACFCHLYVINLLELSCWAFMIPTATVVIRIGVL